MVTQPVPAVVTAWRPSDVVPLEVWNEAIDGRTLFERRSDPDFYDVLVRAIPADPIDVAVVGGGVERTNAEQAFRAARRGLVLADDDPFFAASGAAGELAPFVVDAGQTSVKAVGSGGRTRLDRSSDAALASLVASALDEVAQAAAFVDLVLALPCEVSIADQAVVLGACSYPIEGDARVLVADIAARARARLRSVRVVNDAVLAAHVARRRLPPRARALVLTIGHGVGAAILGGHEE